MSTRPRLVDRPDLDESMAPMQNISILPREDQEPEILPPRQLVRKEGFRAWSEKNLPQDKPETR